MKKIIIILALVFIHASSLFGQNSTFDPLRIGSRIGGSTPGSLLFVDLNKKLSEDNDNLFWDDTNNRLGIGTNSPDSMLDVRGLSTFRYGFGTGTLLIGADLNATTLTDNTRKIGRIVSPGYDIDSNNIFTFGSDSTSGNNKLFYGGVSGSGTVVGATSLHFFTSEVANADSGTERVIIDNTGQVGIGASSPNAMLDVRGSGAFQYGFGTGALLVGADLNGTTLTDNTRKVGRITSPNYDTNSNNIFTFGSDSNSGSNKLYYGGISGSGTVVGATSLHFSTSETANADSGTERMIITNLGRMGLGVSSPATLLEIEDGNATTIIQISNTATDGDPGWGLAFSGTRKWTGFADDGDGDDYKINDGTVSGGATRFRIGGTDGEVQTYSGRLKNTDRLTGNTTLDATYHNVPCDTDGGAFTVTLPAGVQDTEYRISNVGTSANSLTITPNGSELLGGINTSDDLLDGDVLVIIYDNTEGWY